MKVVFALSRFFRYTEYWDMRCGIVYLSQPCETKRPGELLVLANGCQGCLREGRLVLLLLAVSLESGYATPLVQVVWFPQFDLAVVAGRRQNGPRDVPASPPDRRGMIVVTASKTDLKFTEWLQAYFSVQVHLHWHTTMQHWQMLPPIWIF